MKKYLIVLVFVVANSFGQEMISNTAIAADTTYFCGIRNRIKDQTSFIKMNETGENYFKRAELYKQIQDWKNALSDLNNADKLTPNNVAVFYTRGGIKERLDDLQGAFLDFSKELLQLRCVVFDHPKVECHVHLPKFYIVLETS